MSIIHDFSHHVSEIHFILSPFWLQFIRQILTNLNTNMEIKYIDLLYLSPVIAAMKKLKQSDT